jgi:hypothetical protein
VKNEEEQNEIKNRKPKRKQATEGRKNKGNNKEMEYR